MTEDRGTRTVTLPDGSIYKIRDVWTYGYGESHSRLLTCQYAVKQDDGREAWFDCIEVVMYADIEPYEKAA